VPCGACVWACSPGGFRPGQLIFQLFVNHCSVVQSAAQSKGDRDICRLWNNHYIDAGVGRLCARALKSFAGLPAPALAHTHLAIAPTLIQLVTLGFARMVVSEIEGLNILAILV
jgi:hypothetical protein